MTHTPDVWIRGAGIAGLTAAWYLAKAGVRVTLTDTSHLGAGASGMWWGLLNPATGVNPTPVKGVREAIIGFEVMREELGLREATWIRAGIWRPAVDKSLYNGFRKAVMNPDWPAGWLRWDDPVHGLSGNGILRVSAGYAIDTRLWLTTLADRLRSTGVEIREKAPSHLRIDAPIRIETVGASILGDPDWKHLKLHPIKGQLREVDVSGVRGQYPALSGRGYAVQVDDSRWVIGSTYEHDFKDSQPDPAYDGYLIDRFKALFPQPVSVTVVGRWSGVRVGTSTRVPLLAKHPAIPGRWAITGLGSKGLLYSQILGRELAARLTAV